MCVLQGEGGPSGMSESEEEGEGGSSGGEEMDEGDQSPAKRQARGGTAKQNAALYAQVRGRGQWRWAQPMAARPAACRQLAMVDVGCWALPDGGNVGAPKPLP